MAVSSQRARENLRYKWYRIALKWELRPETKNYDNRLLEIQVTLIWRKRWPHHVVYLLFPNSYARTVRAPSAAKCEPGEMYGWRKGIGGNLDMVDVHMGAMAPMCLLMRPG